MKVVESMYGLTKLFPQEEKFGLTSQMRRAAVSIPSNIAEGRRRSTEQDYKHFLHMAYGSVAELETQLEIGVRLGFVKKQDAKHVEELLTEVGKMLHALLS